MCLADSQMSNLLRRKHHQDETSSETGFRVNDSPEDARTPCYDSFSEEKENFPPRAKIILSWQIPSLLEE